MRQDKRQEEPRDETIRLLRSGTTNWRRLSEKLSFFKLDLINQLMDLVQLATVGECHSTEEDRAIALLYISTAPKVIKSMTGRESEELEVEEEGNLTLFQFSGDLISIELHLLLFFSIELFRVVSPPSSTSYTSSCCPPWRLKIHLLGLQVTTTTACYKKRRQRIKSPEDPMMRKILSTLQ